MGSHHLLCTILGPICIHRQKWAFFQIWLTASKCPKTGPEVRFGQKVSVGMFLTPQKPKIGQKRQKKKKRLGPCTAPQALKKCWKGPETHFFKKTLLFCSINESFGAKNATRYPAISLGKQDRENLKALTPFRFLFYFVFLMKKWGKIARKKVVPSR